MKATDVLKFKHTFVKRQFVLVLDKTKMGAALRKMREDAGVSLRSMASKMGCSAPFLSDCELGQRKISTSHLKQFLENCTKD